MGAFGLSSLMFFIPTVLLIDSDVQKAKFISLHLGLFTSMTATFTAALEGLFYLDYVVLFIFMNIFGSGLGLYI